MYYYEVKYSILYFLCSIKHQAMFMDILSYFLSIPLRIIGLALSVQIVLIGKLYDLLFKRNVDNPKVILITGANSGICKEVTLQYAAPV